MKKVPFSILILAVVISLVVGGMAGFFLGIASTEAGARFLEGLVEVEQQADIGTPKSLERERFKLLFPSNWRVDVTDEDYDPDQMFSIGSPGATFVMFVMGEVETNPEDSLRDQIDVFSELMGTSTVQPFDTYGQLHGKGAILQGKLLGIKITVRAFACYLKGTTAIIVQQYPDEDFEYVKEGLRLIEESFLLKEGA